MTRDDGMKVVPHNKMHRNSNSHSYIAILNWPSALTQTFRPRVVTAVPLWRSRQYLSSKLDSLGDGGKFADRG